MSDNDDRDSVHSLSKFVITRVLLVTPAFNTDDDVISYPTV